MSDTITSDVELQDLEDGLWIWRLRHPHWKPGVDWQPWVTSTCVHVGREVILIDPLFPPMQRLGFWQRLQRQLPTAIIILKPDHVRDVDIAATLFSARAFGPSLFWPDDLPKTKLEPIAPGDRLPGGLVALSDGRGKHETPVWLPQHRTLIFADALTERDGTLRVWGSRSHQDRALPALTKLLDLPFERVIISHGKPVHDRAAYEKALSLPPWEG